MKKLPWLLLPLFIVPVFTQAQTSFSPQQTYATGTVPRALAVADFNGDGKQDLAVSNQNSNTISVLTGKADGTFNTQQTYATDAGPIFAAAADFNGDAKIALVTANMLGNSISILLGRGDGTFDPQMSITAGAGTYPSCVLANDFNNDGRQDLAIIKHDDAIIDIFIGNGDGTFNAFELQKSVNGKDYATIASLSATGNNSNYSYNALQQEPVAYYRLAMVDLDGTTDHSLIVTLRQDSREGFSVSPNPANDKINVKVATDGELRVYDAAGHLVLVKFLRAGINPVSINQLKPGLYFSTVNKQQVSFIKK